jgi:transcriptional regulator with XRE-family HTH domain
MNEVQKLLETLKAQGWTFSAVAREIGTSKGTLHRWWKGQRQPANAGPLVVVLRQMLEQPPPKRSYKRKKERQ